MHAPRLPPPPPVQVHAPVPPPVHLVQMHASRQRILQRARQPHRKALVERAVGPPRRRARAHAHQACQRCGLRGPRVWRAVRPRLTQLQQMRDAVAVAEARVTILFPADKPRCHAGAGAAAAAASRQRVGAASACRARAHVGCLPLRGRRCRREAVEGERCHADVEVAVMELRVLVLLVLLLLMALLVLLVLLLVLLVLLVLTLGDRRPGAGSRAAALSASTGRRTTRLRRRCLHRSVCD
eukprot:270421-Chlamydomonas_euryale.AAC.1